MIDCVAIPPVQRTARAQGGRLLLNPHCPAAPGAGYGNALSALAAGPGDDFKRHVSSAFFSGRHTGGAVQGTATRAALANSGD